MVVFSARAAGYAATFAPSYGGAKEAATRIFSTIARRPVIDTTADDGETYVGIGVTLSISCCNVQQDSARLLYKGNYPDYYYYYLLTFI